VIVREGSLGLNKTTGENLWNR